MNSLPPITCSEGPCPCRGRTSWCVEPPNHSSPNANSGADRQPNSYSHTHRNGSSNQRAIADAMNYADRPGKSAVERFMHLEHDYPDRSVSIHFFLVSAWKNDVLPRLANSCV